MAQKAKPILFPSNQNCIRIRLLFSRGDYYKEKAGHHYKIEAKNSELKNVHGYKRATSYGVENMQMQGVMAIFAVNLKRILKLI